MPIEAQNQVVELALAACGLFFLVGIIIERGRRNAERLKWVLRIVDRHR